MALTKRWTKFLMAVGVAVLLFAGFAISFLVSGSHHVFASGSGFSLPSSIGS